MSSQMSSGRPGLPHRLGQANEAGLLVPGLGIETFLDLRMDEAERKAGIEGGTPRTIEGPLSRRAPLSKGEARLDEEASRAKSCSWMGRWGHER